MVRKLLAVTIVVLVVAIVYLTLAPVAAQAQGNDRVLSKVTFIHFRKAPGKPGGGGGGKPKADAGYYTYIASGAKWREVEDFRLNPTNGDGVGAGKIADAVGAGMTAWEETTTPGTQLKQKRKS